jgi:hypothetical protein
MKLTINLRDHVRRVADSDNMLTFEASVDVDNLFETAFIPDECDLDIRDVLDEHHAIALIWDADQVLSHYPHLTKEQSFEVLRECERTYDAEHGLTWDDIGDAVARLYPDPDGFLVPDRVLRVEKALQDYTDSDEAANLVDLLADAMHWCRHKREPFERLLDTARMHYESESSSKEDA